MPQAIVDRLEVVEVDHKEAEPAPRSGCPLDLAIDTAEQRSPVGQTGESVTEGEAHRRVSGASLFAHEHERQVREQDQAGQLDRDPGGLLRPHRRHARGDERDDEKRCRASGAEEDRGSLTCRQDGSGDDQVVADEERAPDAAGRADHHRDERDRDRGLDRIPRSPEPSARDQVVDGEDRDAGDRDGDVDERSGVGPQTADGHDHGRDEQHRIADHPGHSLVGGGDVRFRSEGPDPGDGAVCLGIGSSWRLLGITAGGHQGRDQPRRDERERQGHVRRGHHRKHRQYLLGVHSSRALRGARGGLGSHTSRARWSSVAHVPPRPSGQ